MLMLDLVGLACETRFEVCVCVCVIVCELRIRGRVEGVGRGERTSWLSVVHERRYSKRMNSR